MQRKKRIFPQKESFIDLERKKQAKIYQERKRNRSRKNEGN